MRIINQDKTLDINYDNYTMYIRSIEIKKGEEEHYVYATPDYISTDAGDVELAGPMSLEDAKNTLERIRKAYHLGQKYYEI